MRSIEQRHTSKESVKSSTQLIGMLLLTIMVLSVVGFAFLSGTGGSSNSGNTGNVDYGSGVNQNNAGAWTANVNGQQLTFSNSPESVSEALVDIEFDANAYVGQTVYYSGGALLGAELQSTVGFFAGRLQEACLGECEQNLPERTCSDLMIVFNNSIKNEVRQEENCIFIEGNLQTIDAFLYRLFRII